MTGHHGRTEPGALPGGLRFAVDYFLTVPILILYVSVTLWLAVDLRWTLRSFASFPLATLITAPVLFTALFLKGRFQGRLEEGLQEMLVEVEPAPEASSEGEAAESPPC